MSGSPLVDALQARLDVVRARVADAGGDPERIRIVAVTKRQPVEVVAAAVAVGLGDIGESYVQELAAKADELAEEPSPSVRWHLVGRLQRNKVRHAAPYVHLWHSVDRLSLAAEVAARAPGAAILVQVNVSGQPQQGGWPPERVAAAVEGCLDLGLDVRGLMAIGPQGSAADVRAGFRTVRDLADRLGLPERSMGMSGDLEAAVAEGATMLRIGTALFGPRGEPTVVGK